MLAEPGHLAQVLAQQVEWSRHLCPQEGSKRTRREDLILSPRRHGGLRHHLGILAARRLHLGRPLSDLGRVAVACLGLVEMDLVKAKATNEFCFSFLWNQSPAYSVSVPLSTPDELLGSERRKARG